MKPDIMNNKHRWVLQTCMHRLCFNILLAQGLEMFTTLREHWNMVQTNTLKPFWVMDTKNRKVVILLLCLSVLFSGCSVPVKVYIRNISTQPKRVIFQLNTIPSKEDITFLYQDGIKEPTFDLYKQFTKSIKAKLTGGFYELNVPPQSVVFIEHGINFHSLTYKSITIDGKELLTGEASYKQFTSKREAVSKYSLWFDSQ